MQLQRSSILMKRGMYLQIDLVTARQRRPGIENKAPRAQVACTSSIVGIFSASPIRPGCQALHAATLTRCVNGGRDL